jgi:hypothetical protein
MLSEAGSVAAGRRLGGGAMAKNPEGASRVDNA